MDKFKIVAALTLGILIGALGQRHYDTQGERRAAKIISHISASLQSSAKNPVKKDLVVSKNTSTEHYTADACIVWCFDNRFSPLLGEFLKSRGYQKTDLVKVAGGAKDILGNDGYIVDQIRKSCALHHTREIVLMVHSGCGAYNGEEDQSFYVGELTLMKQVATELLKNSEHPPKIVTVLAQYDGLYEIN